jgi:hypothetical protein
MTFLTESHASPAARILHDGVLIPTAPLIARNDAARLAELSIYRHHPTSDPKPLKSEWILTGGEYHEIPIGTPEEIAAALAAQSESDLIARRAQMQCTPLQGLLAIEAAGLTAVYEVWTSDPLRTFAQRAFIERAQVWKRTDPTLIAAAQSIGLTDENLDQLFELAVTL